MTEEEKTIIREQILQVRNTGLTNMMDVKRVKRIAKIAELKELESFIKNHEPDYVRIIMTGEFRNWHNIQ